MSSAALGHLRLWLIKQPRHGKRLLLLASDFTLLLLAAWLALSLRWGRFYVPENMPMVLVVAAAPVTGLSVLTLAKNRTGHLLNLIEGLRRSEAAPLELVVVDMNDEPIGLSPAPFSTRIVRLADVGLEYLTGGLCQDRGRPRGLEGPSHRRSPASPRPRRSRRPRSP